jgi:pimeloyl-ACP methyl ester carboxylesterase
VRRTVTTSPGNPTLVRADAADLPPAIRAAFDEPPEGRRIAVDAAGIRWSALAWGDPEARPLLLLHGVTASAAIWWRIAPPLAATNRHVVALDLPGHGMTGQWRGHVRFSDNARDVAAFAGAANLARPGLQVVGHSWGGMTAAALPGAGLVPDTLVLLDPPVVPRIALARLVDEWSERYTSLDDARAAMRNANPAWPERDVEAKAEALVQLDVEAARAVVLQDRNWDGGLASLDDPSARDVPVWFIRGELHAGGLVPDAAVPRIAARIGADHVLTLAGAPHAPQRTHPAALLVALLRALDTRST